ncbi:MAG: dTDP-4-dehydrorhamnose reductase [Succinivibrionaceae bacterium]|nr:dTDP-4-dehydrorhamnose reductase [Succinivibrionaceae bacterium]
MSGPRVLLVGGTGLLGRELAGCLPGLGAELLAPSHQELDITGAGAREAILALRPEAVVNAAAYTAVDQAESDREAAFALNATAPGLLAQCAAELGVPLVHVSTDYVLGMPTGSPHVEDEEPHAVGVYAESKLEGERLVAASGCQYLIVRTAWVFGRYGKCFPKSILRAARSRPVLRVVSDQVGCPTPARALAQGIGAMLARAIPDRGACGIYHFAGRDAMSWADFAELITRQAKGFGLLRTVPRVERISSQEFAAAAPRPADSRLSCLKAERDFGLSMPHATDFLRETLEAAGE